MYSFVMSEQNRKIKLEEEKLLQKNGGQHNDGYRMWSSALVWPAVSGVWLVERKQDNYRQPARAHSWT